MSLHELNELSFREQVTDILKQMLSFREQVTDILKQIHEVLEDLEKQAIACERRITSLEHVTDVLKQRISLLDQRGY